MTPPPIRVTVARIALAGLGADGIPNYVCEVARVDGDDVSVTKIRP